MRAKVPHWAIWAGVPAPLDEESFEEYVTRIGLNAEDLLHGLSENQLPIANHRLTTHFLRTMPEEYEAYIREKRRRQWPPVGEQS